MPTHEDYPWERDRRVSGVGGPPGGRPPVGVGVADPAGDPSPPSGSDVSRVVWWRRLSGREERLLVWGFFVGFWLARLLDQAH